MADVESSEGRSTKRLTKVDKFSFWYLFDWKFEHYLTPWIIRALWVLGIVGAGFAVLALTNSLIDSLLPDKTPNYAVTSFPGLGFQGRFEAPGESGWQNAFNRLKLYLAGLTAVIVALLSLRMACESVIVLFNIAGSARVIEKALASNGRGKSP